MNWDFFAGVFFGVNACMAVVNFPDASFIINIVGAGAALVILWSNRKIKDV